MGTANFANPSNASRYYAVLMGEVEDYEIDDYKEGLHYNVCEAFENVDQSSWSDRARNFGFHGVSCIAFSKWYGDVEVAFQVHVGLVSGYYQGATLDWRITMGYDDNEVDRLDVDQSIWLDLKYEYENNPGLAKILAKKAQAWASKILDEVDEKLNDLCSKMCEVELQCVGRFSNGEALYEKVEK